jgi:hypothetical protein
VRPAVRHLSYRGQAPLLGGGSGTQHTLAVALRRVRMIRHVPTVPTRRVVGCEASPVYSRRPEGRTTKGTSQSGNLTVVQSSGSVCSACARWRDQRERLGGGLVRGEDGVENALHATFAEQKRHPPQQRHPLDVERGQLQCVGQPKLLVAEQCIGKSQARRRLALVLGVLGGQAVDRRVVGIELLRQVAERAGLRGTSSGAGDAVPARRRFDAGAPSLGCFGGRRRRRTRACVGSSGASRQRTLSLAASSVRV